VSSFDDEFGLFSETVVDEPEPLDSTRPKVTRAPDHRRKGLSAPKEPVERPSRRPASRERRPSETPADPWAGHRRATELLQFLARKLVQKPDAVSVELFIDENAQPVIELVVDPEDLGKVIGRSGRVAQALRTVVRATAESRVAVDILDSEEASQDSEDEPGA
jgi:uncharacterized protein